MVAGTVGVTTQELSQHRAASKPHCVASEAALCSFVNPKQCRFEATLCGFETTQCDFMATLCGFAVLTQLLTCYPRLTTISYNFTAQIPEPETVTV